MDSNAGNTALTPLRRLTQLMSMDQKDIFYLLLYAIFGGIITLTLPLGIQAIITLIAGGQFATSWGVLIGIVSLGTLVVGLLKAMQITISETIQQRIFARSAFEFTYRLPRLKLESILKNYPPELMNRFFDTMSIQKSYSKLLLESSTATLEVFFGLLLISLYHPVFFTFSLFLVLAILLIITLTWNNGLKSSIKESSYKYAVAHWLQEIARTVTTFKQAGDTELPMQKTDKLVTQYLGYRTKHFRTLMVQFGSVIALKTVVTGVLLSIGGLLVIRNQINIGQFVAAEIVIILVTSAIEKLIISMENLFDLLTAVEKVGQVTDLELESDEGIDFKTIDNGQGLEIEALGLHYRYADGDKDVLRGLDLHIKSGEKVCIVGAPGSGKSTLIHMLSGIYNGYEGQLNINNIPMKHYRPSSLREFIGEVSEDEDIFKGTVFDNIAVGHSEVDLNSVVKAAQEVGLEEHILKMPNGYHTELAPSGKGLPRSVIQKIILARSFASCPRLVTIDEGMTHLSAKEREKIVKCLTEPSTTWTFIAVTNDPIIASHCQRIVVVEDGKIIAEGTCNELLKHPEHGRLFTSSSPDA